MGIVIKLSTSSTRAASPCSAEVILRGPSNLKGLVTTATTLAAADIPDHSAAKLTSGTIGTTLIANDAITADKIGDQATTKFGGAAGSDNVTIFPTGDYKVSFSTMRQRKTFISIQDRRLCRSLCCRATW